jgi:hypothetical protein
MVVRPPAPSPVPGRATAIIPGTAIAGCFCRSRRRHCPEPDTRHPDCLKPAWPVCSGVVAARKGKIGSGIDGVEISVFHDMPDPEVRRRI